MTITFDEAWDLVRDPSLLPPWYWPEVERLLREAYLPGLQASWSADTALYNLRKPSQVNTLECDKEPHPKHPSEGL